jgi:hypothetical protein
MNLDEVTSTLARTPGVLDALLSQLPRLDVAAARPQRTSSRRRRPDNVLPGSPVDACRASFAR